uniref:Uncharacterized protein n=1 Tax=Romanomermis culicivorax TaxID=13658 RepID=A0A915KZG0_ROMCU
MFHCGEKGKRSIGMELCLSNRTLASAPFSYINLHNLLSNTTSAALNLHTLSPVALSQRIGSRKMFKIRKDHMMEATLCPKMGLCYNISHCDNMAYGITYDVILQCPYAEKRKSKQKLEKIP